MHDHSDFSLGHGGSAISPGSPIIWVAGTVRGRGGRFGRFAGGLADDLDGDGRGAGAGANSPPMICNSSSWP